MPEPPVPPLPICPVGDDGMEYVLTDATGDRGACEGVDWGTAATSVWNSCRQITLHSESRTSGAMDQISSGLDTAQEV